MEASNTAPNAGRGPIELAGKLSARFKAGMRPLAIGTGLIVALSAPAADFLLERGDLSRRADTRARELAARLTASGQPPTGSALAAAAREEEDVVQAELVSPAGVQISSTPAKAAWPLLWGEARLGPSDTTVRVALTEPELLGRDLFLLSVFGALGLALTLGLYFFPLRLFREEDLVRLLARRSIQAVEEERLRLSRELHDGVGQTLGAVSLALARIAARLGSPDEVSEGTRLLDGALAELRRVTQGLRPSALDDLGLGPAIEALAREMGNDQLAIAVEVTKLQRLNPEIEHTCYRLAQEALQNAVRHSGARRARVTLRAAGSALVLEVEDDGRGFSPTTQLGLGLVGARERAAAMAGELSIDSRPGGGTRIRASLPISERPSPESE